MITAAAGVGMPIGDVAPCRTGDPPRYRTENDYTTRLRGYDDAREAVAAFLEKRSPEASWP